MADGGYLAPPSQDPSKEKIWVETQKRLDRFLPQLFTEIFPPAPEPPSEQTLPSDEPDVQQSGTDASESDHGAGENDEKDVGNDDAAKEDTNDSGET